MNNEKNACSAFDLDVTGTVRRVPRISEEWSRFHRTAGEGRMVVTAVFAVGFFVGAVRGLFSLMIVQIGICIVVFAYNWGTGFAPACDYCLEIGMVLVTGFIVALIVSVISPKFEREISYWLRGQRNRDRSLVQRP